MTTESASGLERLNLYYFVKRSNFQQHDRFLVKQLRLKATDDRAKPARKMNTERKEKEGAHRTVTAQEAGRFQHLMSSVTGRTTLPRIIQMQRKQRRNVVTICLILR